MIKKTVIYFLLLIGAVIFILPLVWMISTALKPIEQTMSLPPSWLPYRYYADWDGERTAVRLGIFVSEPSVVVRDGAGDLHIIPSGDYAEGVATFRAGAVDETNVAAAVQQQVPASEASPWVKVVLDTKPDALESEAPPAWRVVPRTEITRRVEPRWENFILSIRAMKHFGLYLRNTLLLCLLTVLGTVCSSALAAYGFSRVDWRGRDKVFLLALATMMIPFPVVMVPLYCMFKWLGWIGTLRPLWVGSFFAGAFNVFLLRQFFRGIPKDLSEAARIDGCSEFRIFWQIILPLCRPALMVVGLFQFMATWNDFLAPLIYLTDQNDYTLALGLQFYQSQHGGTEWNYLMAASTLVALPIIVLFFFTQRSFIEGISMSGLKG
ncbi:MAG: carbohydrate ABC transporter permease [Kiritimatiellae bacterium]|nr:carbohydrate ABC transporter permease [Kiritimatiellia bacterium]